eukprot:INCI7471.1.p1 GENE.INCI7471.1~~INCI7471.1.p1  ORF type:complete len:424 (-),score=49.65 INCI7471.1:112-1248(-)
MADNKEKDPNEDPRLDPRLIPICKALAATSPARPSVDEITDDHATLVEKAAAARNVELDAVLNTPTPQQLVIAPPESVELTEGTFPSQPDGNTVRYCFMSPADAPKDAVLPVVYYIHGGGMAMLSSFGAMYQTWGRLLCARSGMCVFLVEFRNSLEPGIVGGPHSSGEVAKYPGGLNDCTSGIRYLHANAADFKVDPDQIFVAGESGGGNLSLASALSLNKSGEIGLVRAVCAMCPFVLGSYPDPAYPSTISNMGILFNNMGGKSAHDYGIEAYRAKDPCAWPIFAESADLAGLPPTLVSVNELDALRDEGLAMYRKLRDAGVAAQARVVVGTCHGAELFLATPEVSRATIDAMAAFFRDVVATTASASADTGSTSNE